jgi:hypothetical protein
MKKWISLSLLLMFCSGLKYLKGQDSNPSVLDNKKNFTFHLGLYLGYLPINYDDFVPVTGGYYDETKVLNEFFVQVPFSIQYKNRFEFELRHFSILQFGHYHTFENFSINTVALGFNPLSFARTKRDQSLFLKLNYGISDFCSCGNDVPYTYANLNVLGAQVNYRFELLNNLFFSFGIENSVILNKIEGKYAWTSWSTGLAMRLF